MIKIGLSIIAVLFFFTISYCQDATNDTARNCSDVLDELSYYWKLDSLANNGYRFSNYKKLLNSKPGKVYRALVLEKLGKPNERFTTNKHTEYVYYYFDINTMPKDYKAPKAVWYISFRFDIYEKYLSEIFHGTLER